MGMGVAVAVERERSDEHCVTASAYRFGVPRFSRMWIIFLPPPPQSTHSLSSSNARQRPDITF